MRNIANQDNTLENLFSPESLQPGGYAYERYIAPMLERAEQEADRFDRECYQNMASSPNNLGLATKGRRPKFMYPDMVAFVTTGLNARRASLPSPSHLSATRDTPQPSVAPALPPSSSTEIEYGDGVPYPLMGR